MICGLTQEYIRSRLLTETDNLSFDRAVEIAISLEGAKLNAQLMKSSIVSHGNHEVHRVGDCSSKPQNHSVVSCYRCGGPHLANKVLVYQRSVTHVVELVTSPRFVAPSPLCYTPPPPPTQACSKGRAPKAANVVEETSPSSLDDLHQVF